MTKQTIESYFKKRMKALKLPDSKNEIKTSYDGQSYIAKWFDIDEKRKAIKLNYFAPDGSRITYMKGKKELEYSRFRLLSPVKGRKYHQEYGTAIESYFTPAFIEAYKAKAKIKTLIIVEGEFKAFAISNILGVPAIGIGGIWSFKDKDRNVLEGYLQHIFETMEIENVILLHDADALQVSYKENHDLAGRLQSFYNSVEQFSEFCKPFNFDLYYYNIQEKYNPESKGIDDLLASKGINAKSVKEEINQFTTGKHAYFDVLNIKTNIFKLYQYYMLNSVDEFYEKHKDLIQDREFTYKKQSYYYDGEKVISNYHKAAFSYLRIGTDYYKKTWNFSKKEMNKPKSERKAELIIEPWKSGTIKQDYGESKKFFSLIPKFDKFINYPANTDYKRIYEVEHEGIPTKFYNIYNPIEHNIKPGEWPTIKKFLTHIFQDYNKNGEVVYNFGMDYIKLSFEEPTLRLPVVCLVSNEKNTGKTIFLEFLRLIFKQNMSILDNERFTGKFTSHFVNKLFVGVDEGFIPMDKPLMKERIKNFSIGKTQWLEAKGKDAKEIDNYCHLLMTSNQEKDFMAMDPDENRFAVLKVKPFKGKNDAKLIDKMELEVPAFLHYLLNDYKLFYPKYISRFSFPTEAYLTTTFARVAQSTRPAWIKELEDWIINIFKLTDFEELYYSPIDLVNGLKEIGIKSIQSSIKNYLQDQYKYYPVEKTKRYNMIPLAVAEQFDRDITEANSISKSGFPYTLKRKDFIIENDDL